MKRFQNFGLVLVSICIFGFSSLYAYVDIDVNGFGTNGWGYPVNKNHMTTSKCCNYDSTTYKDNHGAHHTGIDIGMDHVIEGDSVYAIADGTIIGRRLHCNYNGSYNLSVILVEHKTLDNNSFIAIYGHTAPNDMSCTGISGKYNESTKKISISKGDKLGTLKKYGDTHLHFGIATNTTVSTLFSGWGRDSGDTISSYWKNPETYLTTHLAPISGIFDGAGSLVSPNDDCWGCNKDEVKLHKHAGNGSTGVFQWLHDSSTCSQIDIYSDKYLGDVVIKTKSWAGDTTEQSFKVHMGAYNKVSIKDNNMWTTLAVTTVNELSDSEASLYAYCKTDSDYFYDGERKEVAKDIVDVTHDYFWTGTGSLITQSGQGNDSFGKDKDWAKTYESKFPAVKSLTSFQWYSSYECSEVVISKQGLSTNIPINGISIKDWSASEWKDANCNSLPCTIKADSLFSYYILKIKIPAPTSPSYLNDKYLQVKCK